MFYFTNDDVVWALMPRKILYRKKDDKKPCLYPLPSPNTVVSMPRTRFREKFGLIAWGKRDGGLNIKEGLKMLFGAALMNNSTKAFGRKLETWEVEEVKKGNRGNFSNKAGKRALDEKTRHKRQEQQDRRIERGREKQQVAAGLSITGPSGVSKSSKRDPEAQTTLELSDNQHLDPHGSLDQDIDGAEFTGASLGQQYLAYDTNYHPQQERESPQKRRKVDEDFRVGRSGDKVGPNRQTKGMGSQRQRNAARRRDPMHIALNPELAPSYEHLNVDLELNIGGVDYYSTGSEFMSSRPSVPESFQQHPWSEQGKYQERESIESSVDFATPSEAQQPVELNHASTDEYNPEPLNTDQNNNILLEPTYMGRSGTDGSDMSTTTHHQLNEDGSRSDAEVTADLEYDSDKGPRLISATKRSRDSPDKFDDQEDMPSGKRPHVSQNATQEIPATKLGGAKKVPRHMQRLQNLAPSTRRFTQTQHTSQKTSMWAWQRTGPDDL